MEKQVSEGSLHKWFKGSKSKDGKGGWVNVVTGGTCASDEPSEGTPKCVSSSKRASMTKAERLSAARRKKKADPGQQQKSGAAKPTYVSTDKKKKKMKESYTRALTPLSEKAVKCWKGYEKKGTKKMFGKTVNNCVKKEEVEIVDEAMSSYDRNRKAAAKRAADRNALRRAGKMGGRMERETYRSEGGTEMHYKGYKANAKEEVDHNLDEMSMSPVNQASQRQAAQKVKSADMAKKAMVNKLIKKDNKQDTKLQQKVAAIQMSSFSNWRDELDLLDENRMAAYNAGAGEGNEDKGISKSLANKMGRSNDEFAFKGRKNKTSNQYTSFDGKKRNNSTGRGQPERYRKSADNDDVRNPYGRSKIVQGTGSIKDLGKKK